MRFFIYLIIVCLFSACIEPNDPISENDIVDLVVYQDTYGEALDVDLTDEKMIVAANYQGFIVYDLERNSEGHIISIDSVYNNSDMDPDMGDNRAQEVVISQNHNMAFIVDMYDQIWLYSLNDDLEYIDNKLAKPNCYGGIWLSTTIDDQLDHVKLISLIKHISAEGDSQFDDYSRSVVFHGLHELGTQFPQNEADPVCEFSYNFGDLPEKIDFNNGLLAVSDGELGVKVLKQSSEVGCFDDQGQLIEEFDPMGEDYNCISSGENNKNVCESNPWDDLDEDGEFDCSDGFNGHYVSEGGFIPYIYSSFDLLGEVNSILVRNSVIFTGLSTSNGCYMSLLDNNGTVLDKLSIANGYTINNISEDNGYLALSSGHDGVLLYKYFGGTSTQFIGQINTPYSNNVKVDGNNLIVSTEDGIYIYIIK